MSWPRFTPLSNRHCAPTSYKTADEYEPSFCRRRGPWAGLLAADIITAGRNMFIVEPGTARVLRVTRCASIRFRGSGDSACVRTVSDTPRHPRQTARFTRTSEADRCSGKSLMRSALVRVGVP